MIITGKQGRDSAIAVAGGIAAALLVLAIPVGVIETVVASSGLSEALPLAAPPLGLKARLLMAAFAALMAVALIGVLRRGRSELAGTQDNSERNRGVQGAKKMGFAFSKLTALARGRVAAATERDTMPVLRRADAHPDAPSRAPIFASRDFNGLDIFPQPQARHRTIGPQPEAEQAESEPVAIALASELAMPDSPLPMARDELPQPTFLRPAAPVVVDDVPVMPEPRNPAPTHGLSIMQLTERLERGLAQRNRDPASPSARVIADMPVVPAVPVRDAVAQDADEALRAALGTLRTMADRAR